MTDIQIIRDALEYCRGFAGNEPCYIGMRHCLSEALSALSRLEERLTPKTCEWIDKDDYWQISCGKAFTIIDGTPNDNEMEFCHGCGKTIKIGEVK